MENPTSWPRAFVSGRIEDEDFRRAEPTDLGIPGALEVRLDSASPTSPVQLGNYEVLRRVGAGGLGVVYQARDPRGHHVAIKILRVSSPGRIANLKSEFRSVADLSHPGLCSVYELAVSEACAFMAMEFVDGVDFCSFVRRSPGLAELPTGSSLVTLPSVVAAGALDFERLRAALRALAEAVHALHESGRLHRDLKPSNILVEQTGRVVLVDFGLLDDGSGMSAGPSAGTPAFMAPEQAAGLPAEPASDWYAFGVTLFLALTGELPVGRPGDALRESLDAVRPSRRTTEVPADLDDLCVALLRTEPRARPTGAQILRALGKVDSSDETALGWSAPRPVFLGRTAELAALHADLAKVEARGSVVRWICGGSGMGKTALLRQFLSQAEAMEHPPLLLRGRCFACEAVPYKAVDAVVEALAVHLAGQNGEPRAVVAPEVGSAELAAMFPSLAGLLHTDTRVEPAVADLNELRTRAFSALRELVRSLCELAPVVVAVDDLQWGDADSAQLVRALVAAPGIEGLMFVGTFREGQEAQSPFLRELSGSLLMDAARVLQLQALTAGDALALARACVGTSVERAEFIAAESSGSPFFIETLARYQEPASAPEEQSLEQVVLARVGRLPVGPRRLLELVSVAAQSINLGDAFAVAALGADALPSLRELLSSSLLRAAGFGELDGLEVYHDRIREVVVGSLAASERVAYHRSLALTLEARGAAPEQLAEHFMAAGEVETAVTYALQAAERALKSMAFDRAAHFYELVAESRARPRARVGICIAQANALINAGRCAEAGRVLLDAAVESDPQLALELRRRAAEQLLVAGRVDEGRDVLHSVATAIGLSFPATPRAAMARMSLRLAQLGLSRTVFEPLRKNDDQEQLRLATAFAAARGLSAYDMARGAFFSVETLRLALRAGDPVIGARSLAAVGSTLAYGGSKPLVYWGSALLRNAERIARETKDASLLASVRVHQGIATMTAGRWTDALAVLEPALQTLKREATGYQHERGYGEMTVLLALEALGRWTEVEQRAALCLSEGEATGNLYLRVQASLYLAQCSLIRDVPSEAPRMIRALEAWPAAEDGFLFQHWLGVRASVCHALYCDEPERAHELLEQAWPQLRSSGLLAITFVRIFATQLRAGATLALAARSPSRRRQLLERAHDHASALAREKLPIGVAAAAVARAGHASQTGNRAGAVTALAQAASTFRREGMRTHAACTERALAALSGREGEARVEQVERELRAQGIANPAAWSRVRVPGMVAG